MKAFVAVLLLTPSLIWAQGNMVSNGSFEDLTKKVKTAGSIEQATGWESPTEAKADLYHTYSKSEDFNTPKNMYGDCDPLDGEGYAGILIYADKNAGGRQYLQARLKSDMQEGKAYCVKINVMLAWMSKYASNNISVYVSKKPVDFENIEENPVAPQVKHTQNKIFEDQFEWQAICQTYVAEGGEQFITIGNFDQMGEGTSVEKMKKPKGAVGQQVRGAYYYVDDVSVMNMAGLEECDCERDAGGNSIQVVYSKNVSTDMEVDVASEIELTRVYFDDLSSALNERAMTEVGKVAALLKENPTYKVKVIGHTDPVEEAKATGDVSLNRANAVKAELVEQGVSENKLLVVGEQDFNPVTSDATQAGQAQNRRVVFSVLSQ